MSATDPFSYPQTDLLPFIDTILVEHYSGVKFEFQMVATSFAYDQRLPLLNRWAWIFSQLGLAPLHGDGAYGNHSYRTGTKSFIITRSQMTPTEDLQVDSYCHVVGYDEQSSAFLVEGLHPPSSESYLHHLLYEKMPRLEAILHGHCLLMTRHAVELSIPVTTAHHPYGTRALAESALHMADDADSFFVLRDHGFVSLGKTISAAGHRTLDRYGHLLTWLDCKDDLH